MKNKFKLLLTCLLTLGVMSTATLAAGCDLFGGSSSESDGGSSSSSSVSVAKYTVTFVDYDDAVISETEYEEGAEIHAPEDPTRAEADGYSYTFAGWDSEVAATVSGNVTYKATYTKTAIEYTVTFMDGADVVDTRTYTVENTTISEPAVPTKDGHNSVWESYTLTTGPVTVNAVHTAIPSTVTFDANGGTCETESEQFTWGQAFTLPTAVAPTDYQEFLHWKDSEGNIVADGTWTYTADVIFTAVYSQGSSISVTGLSLKDATVKLTNDAGEVKTVTGVSGEEFSMNVKNDTYTWLEITDGTNDHRFYASPITLDEGEVTLAATDFVEDPINMSLQANAWRRQDFVRNYTESDGVYYTLNNPANGSGPNGMMYTYAPLTLDASNKVTLSYDVTVEEGGPLCFGISLGAHRSELSNGTDSKTPYYHLWVRLNATTGAFEWSNAYDYNGDVAGDGNILNLFWSQGKPAITGFGNSFNVKIVRDNSIVAFFINNSLAFYLNEDVKPIISGYELGDTPLYYAISVRSNNAGGTGSATFKNITASNTADLSACFTTVTGTNSALNADASLTISGIDSISGRNITLNQTMANVVDANGNFSFVVPYGTYTVSATDADGNEYEGVLTANSAAQSLELELNNLATIGATTLSGAVRSTSIPTDVTYSENGTKITFAGVSTGAQAIYTLKNTVGKNFTFETTITGDATKLVGAGVTCGGEQITVMFAAWEAGNAIIQATGHASSGSDFIVTGVDDVIDDNNQINATLKFVQNGTTSLTIYVNDKLLCTITSAGFALGDGIAYKTETDQTNAEATGGWWSRGTVAIRYLTRGEFACALTGYMTASETVSYTVSFKESV